MKFVFDFLNHLKASIISKKRREVSDYKREVLLRQGQEQFKALIRKGLSIPVTLL